MKAFPGNSLLKYRRAKRIRSRGEAPFLAVTATAAGKRLKAAKRGGGDMTEPPGASRTRVSSFLVDNPTACLSYQLKNWTALERGPLHQGRLEARFACAVPLPHPGGGLAIHSSRWTFQTKVSQDSLPVFRPQVKAYDVAIGMLSLLSVSSSLAYESETLWLPIADRLSTSWILLLVILS